MHDNDGLKFYLYEFSLTEIQKILVIQSKIKLLIVEAKQRTRK